MVFGYEDHTFIGYLLGIIVPLFGLVIGIGDEKRIPTSGWLEQLEVYIHLCRILCLNLQQ
ncbi:hypothetical protein TorRG33x02_169010 [Trema orientale]|uniref:Uncharacterized protein n=1 Tax=Trema orientale TaxID=63057 RepID=A0A2P5EP64_TREOI|nr:hypothetical protein TorRG33x02_169010 [Trema orientale]